MIIRINRKNRFEQIAIEYLIVMGLISGIVEHSGVWNILLVAILGMLLIGSKKFRQALFRKRGCLLWIVGLIFLISTNIILSGETGDYLVDNLLKLFKPLVVVVILLVISQEEDSFLPIMLRKNFKIFNLFWIANLLVLSIQVTGNGFLIKEAWLAANGFYEDHCSGLFGNSGTHMLSFFSIFMLIYNLYMADYIFRQKKLLYIYSFITALYMLMLSTKNDNSAIFLLYFVFTVSYFIFKLQWKSKGVTYRLKKYVKYIILFVIILVTVSFIPVVKEFLNNVIISKMSGMFVTDATNAQGGTERLAIVAVALRNGFGWKFGLGIGKWPWSGTNFYGFSHFGLSSIGGIIFLAGIWFYIYMCIMYSVLFANCNLQKRHNISYVIFILIFVLVVSMFTTIFTFAISMLWFFLMFCIFGMLEEAVKSEHVLERG